MSKGLEAFNTLPLNTLKACGNEEALSIIENELKALEIIVKSLDIELFRLRKCYIKTQGNYYVISRKEYDLLKEVLL